MVANFKKNSTYKYLLSKKILKNKIYKLFNFSIMSFIRLFEKD